jgi:cold shock CspA family protein
MDVVSDFSRFKFGCKVEFEIGENVKGICAKKINLLTSDI